MPARGRFPERHQKRFLLQMPSHVKSITHRGPECLGAITAEKVNAMKTIMVAMDFTERSDRTLRRAVLLARQFSASLAFVHVVDQEQSHRAIDNQRAMAEQLLGELAATLRQTDGLACGWQVPVAEPVAGIVGASEELAPDLMVIGRHQRQLVKDAFVGTTAERTIRTVACPVLMANSFPVGAYRRVLLTTDLSDCARNAVTRFTQLDCIQSALTTMLYVFDAPAIRLAMSHSIPADDREYYIEEERREAGRALAAFCVSTGLDNVEQVARFGETGAASEILAEASRVDAGLIVVGTQGRSGLAKLFLGSVAEEVLRSADRDVLAIPPPGNL